jgi:PhnB protein
MSKAGPRPIPEGYHTLTPYLILRGAAKGIEFYQKAFGAELILKVDGAGGKVGHAEMRIGNSMIMMADEFPEMGARSAEAFGGSPVSMALYVDDADAWFARAVAAGARVERPLENKFYGDRSGTVVDPFGFRWHISTHVEDVSAEEMSRRLGKQGS